MHKGFGGYRERDVGGRARTLATSFSLGGIGLHRAGRCEVTVSPAEGGGLSFLHAPTGTLIPALAKYVGDLSLATTLTKGGVRLQTVEHLLSALNGLGIDHALIEVGGEELPILDGSAAPWAEAIATVGIRELPQARNYIKVMRPVHVHRGGRSVSVYPSGGSHPSDNLSIRCTIDFSGSSIGRQSFELPITPQSYLRELSGARTFCLKSEIDHMRSRGLALGGSLENAVVYDDGGYLNESLRFDTEAVRHKMLDLLGDLALLGAPLIGTVEAHAAGHALHVALVKKLMSEKGAWVFAQAEKSTPQTHYLPNLEPTLAAV